MDNLWLGGKFCALRKAHRMDPHQAEICSLTSGSHYVGQAIYHFEWCPKYRYKMFRKEKKNLCEEILRQVAERHKIELIELSVMPEQIHAVVSIPPSMSVSEAFKLLKGVSSRALFQREPKFRFKVSERQFLE